MPVRRAAKMVKTVTKRPQKRKKAKKMSPAIPLPVAPASVEAIWQRGWIELTLKNGRTQRVSAVVYGSLAVHKAIDPHLLGQWALTHVPSGLRIIVIPREASVLRIGETLWNRCCLVFREKTKKAIGDKLPVWTLPWLLECYKQQKYLDPEVYIFPPGNGIGGGGDR